MNEKEKALLGMVLEGNLNAFEPLFNPYRRSLLNLAYRMSRNWEDAREISQETLMRAFKYLKRYDQRRSFRDWILQILINVAKDFSQQKERTKNLFHLTQGVSATDRRETNLIRSNLTIKSGEKTVVGVSKMDGGDKGLILIISGKVIK
jgi:RNA polymerase sigma-70 factor (ECF subfamily)